MKLTIDQVFLPVPGINKAIHQVNYTAINNVSFYTTDPKEEENENGEWPEYKTKPIAIFRIKWKNKTT